MDDKLKDPDYFVCENEHGICEFCEKTDVPVDKDETCEECFYDNRESW